jgi:hypothetical protein
VSPRLVVCMILSALVGTGAAALCLLGGLGVIVALLAYSGTTSITLFVLAVVTAEDEVSKPARPSLLPAPRQHGIAWAEGIRARSG